MAICPALRGITLIFTLLDKGLQTRRWGENIVAFQKHGQQSLHTSNRASRCGVQPSTPHSSGFREPCIWPFLNNLEKMTFSGAGGSSFYVPSSMETNTFISSRWGPLTPPLLPSFPQPSKNLNRSLSKETMKKDVPPSVKFSK